MYLGRAPRTKETLPDFRERCRVARHSRAFRGLTGSQRTPEFWGVTLMLIIDLCLFGSPIGVIELILFQKYPYVLQKLILVLRILYLYYGVYTCLADLILVSQSLFLYFGSYTYIMEHILVLRDLFLCEGTRRFILVHISRRAHICTYIRFIYLYMNT